MDLFDLIRQDHRDIMAYFGTLRDSGQPPAARDEALRQLGAALRLHAEEEEDDIFGAVRQLFKKEEIAGMAERWQTFKQERQAQR